MVKIASAVFVGASSTQYVFEVHSPDAEFADVSAVYIFTEFTKLGHRPLHIGESDGLGTCIATHETRDSVDQRGCNCICVHFLEEAGARVAEAADLLSAYETPCN